MNANLKKFLVPTVTLILGVLIGLFAFKSTAGQDLAYEKIYKQQKDIQDEFDRFFNEEFFNQTDPFQSMQIMRKRMADHMKKIGGKSPATGNSFDSWYSNKFGGGTVNDINKREDDHFVYYDIKIKDLNSTPITTSLLDGHIKIWGQTEKVETSDQEGITTKSIFKSSFSRTLPLPEGVKEKQMEVITDKDKVTLKFPKTSSKV